LKASWGRGGKLLLGLDDNPKPAVTTGKRRHGRKKKGGGTGNGREKRASTRDGQKPFPLGSTAGSNCPRG